MNIKYKIKRTKTRSTSMKIKCMLCKTKTSTKSALLRRPARREGRGLLASTRLMLVAVVVEELYLFLALFVLIFGKSGGVRT